MIKDTRALSEVRKSWGGVEALRQSLQLSAFSSMAGPLSGSFPFKLADAAHNLPFLHAYAVLSDVLRQLADEGRFKCKSHFLGPLLKVSEKVLPWRDFAQIRTGYEHRNRIAHEGHLLQRGDCWKYIDALKLELSTWGVL